MRLNALPISGSLWLVTNRAPEPDSRRDEHCFGSPCAIDVDLDIARSRKGQLAVFDSATGLYAEVLACSSDQIGAAMRDYQAALDRMRRKFIERLMSRKDAYRDDWIAEAEHARGELLHALEGLGEILPDGLPPMAYVRSDQCPFCGGQLYDGLCVDGRCALGRLTHFCFIDPATGLEMDVSGKDGLQFAEKTDLDRIRDGNFGA